MVLQHTRPPRTRLAQVDDSLDALLARVSTVPLDIGRLEAAWALDTPPSNATAAALRPPREGAQAVYRASNDSASIVGAALLVWLCACVRVLCACVRVVFRGMSS